MSVSSNGAGQGQNDGQRSGNEDGGNTDDDEDDLRGLLNDDGDGADDENGDGEDGNGDGGNADGANEPQYMTQQDVESALDRRINAVIREVRKNRQRDEDDYEDDEGRGQQRRGGKGNRSQKQTPQAQGPSREDVREARSTYREFVSDEVKFLGNEEREFARSLAESQINRGLGRGDDPEDVGRDVAESVASDIKRMRSFYESRTVAALRRKGALPKKTGSQQQPQQSGGGSQVGVSGSGWQKGQSKAKEMFADRLAKQNQQ